MIERYRTLLNNLLQLAKQNLQYNDFIISTSEYDLEKLKKNEELNNLLYLAKQNLQFNDYIINILEYEMEKLREEKQ